MVKVFYYKRIRKMGAFPALGAWNLAKEAEALDKAAYVFIPPPTISREVMMDGSGAIHLSFGVRVF